MQANQIDVVFDYQGALDLARQLWSLGDEIAHVVQVRRELTDWARQGFGGACADQFSSRMSEEERDCKRVSWGLGDDALAVAQTWKAAMEEENRRLYARHVDDLKSNRSDFAFGYQYPPAPAPVPLPLPPAFPPTAELVRYR